MRGTIDLDRIKLAIERWQAVSEATEKHCEKLEVLLPKANMALMKMDTLTVCFQKPLEEATSEAIETYKSILSEGTKAIQKEAVALTHSSKRLHKESEIIQEAAKKIRVFSVISVGLSVFGMSLIGAIAGFIIAAREGYQFAYKKGFAEGTISREFQIENQFLERKGLRHYESNRNITTFQVLPGYKITGKQSEQGYFIYVYRQ